MRLENLALRWMAEQQYADTTRTTYMETVRQLSRRFPLQVERITAEHLIDFLTLDDDGSKTGRSANTRHRQRTTLRCMFRWAHSRGYVRRDPAANLGDLMLGRGRRRAGRWLTREQAIHLLASIDTDEVRGHRDHILILTGFLTGLRRAEMAAMQWRHVDISQGRIAVMGKGSKPATIGVPDELAAGLSEWHERAKREAGPAKAGAPVFPTGHMIGGGVMPDPYYSVRWDRPMCIGNVHRIVAERASAAGLGLVGTHDLRRSFAGWLDEDGIDLAGIQAALRHGSPSVTVSCYLNPSPRRAVQAVQDLRISLSPTQR